MTISLKYSPKRHLKELLLECTHEQQLMFKRMFCTKHLEYNLDQALNQMDTESIDMALNQCKRIVKSNKEKKL